MPSNNTITSSDFTVFTPATKARSAEVNANFSVFRGHLLPLSVNTSSAATSGTYDLGASDHFWRNLYLNTAIYQGVTSTTNLTVQRQSATAGAYELLIGSTTVGSYGITGFGGPYQGNGAIPIAALATGISVQTFTSNGTFTIPTGVNWVTALIVAGGGGGGGGGGSNVASGSGGGGGASGMAGWVTFSVAGLTVLSVTVGGGGGQGLGGGAGSNGTAGGAGSNSAITAGGVTYTCIGGAGGGKGNYNADADGTNSGAERFPAQSFAGGQGGNLGSGGGNGESGDSATATLGYAAGTPGAGGGANAGGGGGAGSASPRGVGGNGGNGGGGGGAGASASTPSGYGGGGGGGGGACQVGGGINGGNGAVGAQGIVEIYYG